MMHPTTHRHHRNTSATAYELRSLNCNSVTDLASLAKGTAISTHASNRLVTSISAFPFPIEPSVRTLFAEKRKTRIVPIGMCQVPPIDSQQAPSPSRGRNTSISVSTIPIRPAVRTLFAKRLKIRSVPIGMCQVPPIDSQ